MVSALYIFTTAPEGMQLLLLIRITDSKYRVNQDLAVPYAFLVTWSHTFAETAGRFLSRSSFIRVVC